MSTQQPLIVNEHHVIKVLLVDDQQIVGETVRTMLASEPEWEYRYCSNPAEAIDIAIEFRPTVILQDLVMPEIDGLQLVKFLRSNPFTRDTPLVVLSSKEEPVIKARAFALGANDYMVKLPDQLELIARIRYHSRGYINLLERNEAYRALGAKQQELAAEIHRAARYVQSLLPAPLQTEQFKIDWRFVPSTQLAGDMFGYHWVDQQHFALYLLDVSGHGVGSALLAVSAANVISSGGLPGVDPRNPGQVVTKLNEMFQMDRQDGKYFTIWYGVYHVPSQNLHYCNAGHPPAILRNKSSSLMLEVDGPAVGMVPDLPYDTHTTRIEHNSALLIYSDGIFEIEQADGCMWPFDSFIDHINSELRSGGDVITRHLSYCQANCSQEALADDFSMMLVQF